jgi:hypothetical protein
MKKSRTTLWSFLATTAALTAACVTAHSQTTTATNTIPAEFAVPSASVNRSAPGFRVRPHEVEENQPNTLAWTEDQLAGLHGPNLAELSGADATGFYNVATVINFDITGGIGNFNPDDAFPGIPGTATRDGGTGNAALEILTFLEFPAAGTYVMGVNSDDGFRVTAGRAAPDRLGVNLGEFDAGRGTADTLFTVIVTQAGVYPFRLVWFNGGGGANLEWFTVDSAGTKILINDTAAGALKAFRTASTPPYAKSATPAPGATLVSPSATINITLADSTTAVQTSSVKLFLDSQPVTPTVTKPAGSTETTITFDPPGDMTRAVHQVRVVFGDNSTPVKLATNEFTFSTEEQLVFTVDDKTMWKYDRSGQDLGTAWREKAFNDTAWPEGAALIADESGATVEPIRTPISRNSDEGTYLPTIYFRRHFNFAEKSISGVKLYVRHVIDDGAIFYLNGKELLRFGYSPGVAVDFNNTAAISHENAWVGPVEVAATDLLPGDNVFAVEVHQTGTGSSDLVFGAELRYKVAADSIPPAVLSAYEGSTAETIQLVFSEFLDTASAQNPANYSVALTAGGGALTVQSVALSGTNVVLTTTPRTVGANYTATVRNVKDISQNTIAANTAISVGKRSIIVAIDDKTMWRYDRSAQDLGTAWKEKAYNDSSWPEGPALLADESGATPEPIRTPISRFADDGTYVTAFYLRTHFNFTGDPKATLLELRHIVDDGAIFYLNGVEVLRFGYAAGVVVTFDNTAASGHENAYEGPVAISSAGLVKGDNVLAAEVHQSGTGSSDLVFGAELVAIVVGGGSDPNPPPARSFSSFAKSGSNLVLNWTGTATLQSADAVTGPWTDVANATSPFSGAIAGQAKFYRLK